MPSQSQFRDTACPIPLDCLRAVPCPIESPNHVKLLLTMKKCKSKAHPHSGEASTVLKHLLLRAPLSPGKRPMCMLLGALALPSVLLLYSQASSLAQSRSLKVRVEASASEKGKRARSSLLLVDVQLGSPPRIGQPQRQGRCRSGQAVLPGPRDDPGSATGHQEKCPGAEEPGKGRLKGGVFQLRAQLQLHCTHLQRPGRRGRKYKDENEDPTCGLNSRMEGRGPRGMTEITQSGLGRRE